MRMLNSRAASLDASQGRRYASLSSHSPAFLACKRQRWRPGAPGLDDSGGSLLSATIAQAAPTIEVACQRVCPLLGSNSRHRVALGLDASGANDPSQTSASISCCSSKAVSSPIKALV